MLQQISDRDLKILASLIENAMRKICTITSEIENGRSNLNLYDLENYRCEAGDFRNLDALQLGPENNPEERVGWYKYEIPAVKMRVCRFVHSDQPPVWFACPRHINHLRLGYVFDTIPGPSFAEVVNAQGEVLTENLATGMKRFQAQRYSVTVDKVANVGGRDFRHELVLTQVNPSTAMNGSLPPQEVHWKGQYRTYSYTLKTNVELSQLRKYFKFTSKLQSRSASPATIDPSSFSDLFPPFDFVSFA
ncbi:uncharacterized protein JCM6883_004212 [Sporobolomyces salmoneus]|uniref:uncharacterized protein n=1 Tax=Sporobolomyces salmoneus TaxID=183962 RepID=UPI00317A978F